VKLLTVAALSAVLGVPCFANALVSSNSPNIPIPLPGGGKKAITAFSPNIPIPLPGGGKKA
jgi:hypothetical protein